MCRSSDELTHCCADHCVSIGDDIICSSVLRQRLVFNHLGTVNFQVSIVRIFIICSGICNGILPVESAPLPSVLRSGQRMGGITREGKPRLHTSRVGRYYRDSNRD